MSHRAAACHDRINTGNLAIGLYAAGLGRSNAIDGVYSVHCTALGATGQLSAMTESTLDSITESRLDSIIKRISTKATMSATTM